MNNYRSAALALAACAASLTATACTAGISTVTPHATSAATPSHSASVARSSSSEARVGRMISVSGSVGSFPVPAGAKVAENIADGQESIVIFSSITPAKVSSFYATALPQAGYTISGNSLVTQGGGTVGRSRSAAGSARARWSASGSRCLTVPGSRRMSPACDKTAIRPAWPPSNLAPVRRGVAPVAFGPSEGT